MSQNWDEIGNLLDEKEEFLENAIPNQPLLSAESKGRAKIMAGKTAQYLGAAGMAVPFLITDFVARDNGDGVPGYIAINGGAGFVGAKAIGSSDPGAAVSMAGAIAGPPLALFGGDRLRQSGEEDIANAPNHVNVEDYNWENISEVYSNRLETTVSPETARNNLNGAHDIYSLGTDVESGYELLTGLKFKGGKWETDSYAIRN